MDKYFFAIVALIIFSVLIILYLRFYAKTSEITPDSKDPLDNLKADDFTLLE